MKFSEFLETYDLNHYLPASFDNENYGEMLDYLVAEFQRQVALDAQIEALKKQLDELK